MSFKSIVLTFPYRIVHSGIIDTLDKMYIVVNQINNYAVSMIIIYSTKIVFIHNAISF